MLIQINGQGIKVSEWLREVIKKDLQKIYNDFNEEKDGIKALVVIKKEKMEFVVTIEVSEPHSSVIKVRGHAFRAEIASSAAIHTLKLQIHKYRDKLKSHRKRDKISDSINFIEKSFMQPDYNDISFDDSDYDAISQDESLRNKEISDQSYRNETLDPKVISTNNIEIRTLNINDAVEIMLLEMSPIKLFINTNTNKLNLLYNRTDGHIGWIEIDKLT